MNIIEGVCIVAGLLFVGVMLGFHCFISSQNITTNEYCKRMWQTISGNPFDKYHNNYLGVIASKILPGLSAVRRQLSWQTLSKS